MAKGIPATHPEERNALNWSPGKNWVEKAGGLPSYINSVAVALVRGGMPRERAIPAAVSVVKKTCATGLWGGRPNAKVSPAIRAAACRASAEWEAKKGKSDMAAAAAGCPLDLAFDEAKHPRDSFGRFIAVFRKIAKLNSGEGVRTDSFTRVDRVAARGPRSFRVTRLPGRPNERRVYADSARDATHVALGHNMVVRSRIAKSILALPPAKRRGLNLSSPVVSTRAQQPMATNALVKGASVLRARHLRVLARANANLTRAGMPKRKRKAVLSSLAQRLKGG